MIGTCAGLRLLDVPCRDAQLPPQPGERASWLLAESGTMPADVIVRVAAEGSPTVTRGTTYVTAVSPAPLDEPTFKRVLLGTDRPWYSPQPPMYSYAGNSFSNIQQNQWVLLFGVIALTEFMLAALLTALSQFSERARSLAPAAALSARRSPMVVGAAYLLMAPAIVGGLTAVALGWVLVQVPVSAGMAPQVEPALLLAASSVIVTVGLAAGAFGLRAGFRAASDWRPGRT